MGPVEFQKMSMFDNITLETLLKRFKESRSNHFVDFDNFVLKEDVYTKPLQENGVTTLLKYIYSNLNLTTLNGLDQVISTDAKWIDNHRVRNHGVDFSEYGSSTLCGWIETMLLSTI